MAAFSNSYTFIIIDSYSSKLNKIRKNTDKFTSSIDKAHKRAGKFSSKMLNMQNRFATFAGTMGIGFAVKKVIDFETAMNKVQSILLITGKDTDKLRKKARDLALDNKFSAEEIVKGMVFLGQAGQNTDQILKSIRGTLRLATAGAIDLSKAADINTNILAQMGLKVKDLARVNDVLALAQAKANTDISQFAEAMIKVGPTAKTVNMSLEQTAAFLGILANNGIKGSEAGTLLMNMLRSLVNPTRKAVKNLKQLTKGVDFSKFMDRTGKMKDLSGLIDTLTKRGATAGQVFTMLGIRGAKAFFPLSRSGKKNIDKFKKSLDEAIGTAKKMEDIVMQGLPGAFYRLKNSIENLTLSVFGKKGILANLETLFNKLSHILNKLSELNPFFLKTAGKLAIVVAAIGPIIITLGLLAFAIENLIGLFATGGIAAVVFTKSMALISTISSLVMSGTLTTTLYSFAMTKLTAVMGFLFSPVTLIIGAIALFGFVLFKIYKKSKIVRDAVHRLGNAFKPLFRFIGVVVKGLGVLIGYLIRSSQTGKVADAKFDDLATVINLLAAAVEWAMQLFTFLSDTIENFIELGAEKSFQILGEQIKAVGGIINDYLIGKVDLFLEKLHNLVGWLASTKIGSMFGDVSDMATNFVMGTDNLKSTNKENGVSSNGNKTTGVAANYSKAQQVGINGGIDINVTGPGRVTRSRMKTTGMGNLGLNMAGAG